MTTLVACGFKNEFKPAMPKSFERKHKCSTEYNEVDGGKLVYHLLLVMFINKELQKNNNAVFYINIDGFGEKRRKCTSLREQHCMLGLPGMYWLAS